MQKLPQQKNLPNLQKPHKKWSIGKYLRFLKRLRLTDPSLQKLSDCPIKNEYLQSYISQGLCINKLTFGKFFLKNGLSYEGIMSTEALNPNEMLIRVPRNLLLTTRDAYMSEISQILKENPEKFWLNEEIDEDSILVLFILHEFQKGKTSKFYHLILSLPKDQDILCFWPVEDIEMFEDKLLAKKSVKKLLLLKENYYRLKEIVKNYPQIISPETFSFENYCWISCVIANRSFGTTVFKYTTMIPFAENFNHECIDSYIYWDEKKENLENQQNQEQIITGNDITTSNQSSEEFLTEDEEDFVNYHQSKSNEFKEIKPENKENNDKLTEIKQWIAENLCLTEHYSLVFAFKLLSFVNECKDVETQEIIEICKEFRKCLENLFKEYLLYDDYAHYCEYCKPNEKKQKLEVKTAENIFEKHFEEESFDFLEFRVGKKEKYEKNSQVYYCYGRKSNNLLAECYGMAIEYNKYGNVFLKLNYKDLLNLNEIFYSLTKDLLILKHKTFKLKYTKINEELLVFFKLLNFDFTRNKVSSLFKPFDLDLEFKAVNAIIDFIDFCYQKSNFTMSQNEQILVDKNSGYRQYFAAIYRLEKQRILKLQRNLFEVYREILIRLKNGMSFDECIKIVDFVENQDEFNRNRYLLHDYLIKLEF